MMSADIIAADAIWKDVEDRYPDLSICHVQNEIYLYCKKFVAITLKINNYSAEITSNLTYPKVIIDLCDCNSIQKIYKAIDTIIDTVKTFKCESIKSTWQELTAAYDF